MVSRPLHILFVDDVFETRDFFRLSFSLTGHTCETVHNGSRALQVITQKAYNLDVVIMDYNMPDMTGLDVVQELRQQERLPKIPIILFTGNEPGQIEREAQELGVEQVLYKPIRPADLMNAVEKAVIVGSDLIPLGYMTANSRDIHPASAATSFEVGPHCFSRPFER